MSSNSRRSCSDRRPARSSATIGADVVHIEHPQIGDAYRYLPQLRPLPECDENYCWILTSRGKRSIALDVRSEQGHAVALDLVRGSY